MSRNKFLYFDPLTICLAKKEKKRGEMSVSRSVNKISCEKYQCLVVSDDRTCKEYICSEATEQTSCSNFLLNKVAITHAIVLLCPRWFIAVIYKETTFQPGLHWPSSLLFWFGSPCQRMFYLLFVLFSHFYAALY